MDDITIITDQESRLDIKKIKIAEECKQHLSHLMDINENAKNRWIFRNLYEKEVTRNQTDEQKFDLIRSELDVEKDDTYIWNQMI